MSTTTRVLDAREKTRADSAHCADRVAPTRAKLPHRRCTAPQVSDLARRTSMAPRLPPLVGKEDALMNRHWTIGLCLSLLLTSLLIGGLAFDVAAQQPTAPAPAAPAAPAAPDSSAPNSAPSAPQSQSPQMQAPSSNVQTETRTEKSERIVEREPGTILGVNPTIALIVGAAVLIVIVFAFVSMSRRREDEIHHTHTRA